jgi:uncharacterized protein
LSGTDQQTRNITAGAIAPGNTGLAGLTLRRPDLNISIRRTSSDVNSMTAARGLRILIIGGIAIVSSCVPLGSAIYQSLVNRPQIELTVGEGEQRIEVTPNKGARIVYDLHVRTNSVQEELENGTASYQARYRFPVSYTVSNAGGRKLTEENSFIDWRQDDDGTLRKRQSSLSESAAGLDATGGTLNVRAAFRKFEVPDDGVIIVSTDLGEDSDYQASAERAALSVEHDVVDPLFNIMLGVFILVGGWITAVMGLVLFLSASSNGAPRDLPVGDISADARRQAMFCHLAGFLGFVIPLGNVIGPLAVWMANRENNAFVDDQGREALNFQLTILVYMLLSFALVLVLIGLLMFPLVWIFQICLMVVAAVKTNDGELYRYPLTIRFLS